MTSSYATRTLARRPPDGRAGSGSRRGHSWLRLGAALAVAWANVVLLRTWATAAEGATAWSALLEARQAGALLGTHAVLFLAVAAVAGSFLRLGWRVGSLRRSSRAARPGLGHSAVCALLATGIGLLASLWGPA